jgi:hypothetical protein
MNKRLNIALMLVVVALVVALNFANVLPNTPTIVFLNVVLIGSLLLLGADFMIRKEVKHRH